MKYAAVIFDLFGTLVHEPSRNKSLSVLKEMANTLSVPPGEFITMWRQTGDKRNLGILPTIEANIKYICQELGITINETQVRHATFLRTEGTRHPLQPRSGAVQVLAQLKSLGYRTGLISNCTPEVPILWKETPLAPLFDVAVFSSLEGMRKPDIRIYYLAAERLGIETDKCLYIGDGDSDELNGAVNAGMHPVMIKILLEEPSDDPRNKVEEWKGLFIDSLESVLNLL